MEEPQTSQDNENKEGEPIDVSNFCDENLHPHSRGIRKPPQKSSVKKATISAEEIGTDKGNTEIICNICGVRTTYKELDKHKNTEKHRSAYAKLAKQNRKERKIRMKENKKAEPTRETKSTVVRSLLELEQQTTNLQDKRKIKETYHLRCGNPLPELHHLYIVTLSTFFALKYSLSKDNRDFRISVINSGWNEFGDIVIEFCVYELIDEIQAIQCKQVQTRSSILVSTLAAEMGKFSIKSRCDILEQLKKKKNNYDKAYFKLFTVSNVQVNKDDLPKFVYDDDTLKQWKSDEDKEKWKDKELKIPEYKKMHLLNTTDDPDDICIFKVVDKDNKQVINDLNKFSMFTNQRKLEGLKKSIKLTLKNKFENCEDISDELIRYVSEHFNQKKTCKKLSRKNFLLKIVELLLKPRVNFPESVIDKTNLAAWNITLQNFDLIIIRNQRGIDEKMYKCFNYILHQETKFSERNGKLKIEKSNISNERLSSIIFEKYEETIELTLSQAYLALWKAKFIPFVLLVNDENELNTINNIITFLHEEHITLKFIIITDLKIDISVFSENLKIFLNLKDLQNDEAQTTLDNLKDTIEIKVCNVKVLLKEIVELNPHFLATISPDVLLNMLLGDYSFRYVDISMTHDVIVDDPLVLRNEDVKSIQENFSNEDDDTQVKDLSYVVDVKGKPVHVKVPPLL